MRSGNIELKSDLANLFKDLEEAKRDSRNVVSISKPKIDQSDIKELFSSLEEASKEARVVKKKRKDYVETTPADLSNLLQGLEEASVEAKKSNSNNEEKLSEFSNLLEKITVVEETKKPEEETGSIESSEDNPIDDITSNVSDWINKSKEENDKLDALEELLTVSVDQVAKDIEEEEVELLSKLDDNPKSVKEEIGLIDSAISHLGNKKKKKKLTVKEEIDDITTLRKEFDNFRSLVAQQISSSQMSGAGSGEVRLEFLDDVQRTSAKVNGKFLKFDSTLGKFIGSDASETSSGITGVAASGLTGNTLASGVTASSLTSVGTLTSLAVSGNVAVAGNLTVSGTTTSVNQTEINVTNAFVFEGASADAHETIFRINEPTTDRIASLQDKTGTIALLSGFKLDATDGSASNDGDFLVLNTSADENDRLLFEDGTTDPLSVLASHGITLVGQGWNAFRFDNT